MPPKKRNTRAAQLQPQPAQSDYETDTANITDNNLSNYPTKPPPTRTNTELNLLVLKRYNPEVERIIQIAHFAVVYTFSPETEGWEKTGLEGTMFLCQLSGASYSRYSVMILNRKGLDNFVVELDSAEQVQVAEEYVMLQVVPEDGVPQVYGLWIFSEEGTKPTTLEVMAMAMQECALRAEEGKKIAGIEIEDESEDEYGGEEATYEQSYGLDDTPRHGGGEPPQPAQQQQPSGQQIDLLKLFGQSQVQPETHIPERPFGSPASIQPISQPRFATNADTDFFRTSRSPAVATQAQQPPPPQAAPTNQQSALLDLFKNARR